MHAFLVTFHFTANPAEVKEIFSDHALALTTMAGLVCSTWILADDRFGTYQVYINRLAAEQYVAGDHFKQVKTNTDFSDFEIHHFEVVDRLSLIAVTPQIRRS